MCDLTIGEGQAHPVGGVDGYHGAEAGTKQFLGRRQVPGTSPGGEGVQTGLAEFRGKVLEPVAGGEAGRQA